MMRCSFLAMALAPLPVLAQAREPPALERGDFMVERTVGFSWFSPGGSWGDVTDRRVYLTGIRGSWLRSTSGDFALAYTMELVPLAVVERTKPNSKVCWFAVNGAHICRIDTSERVAFGAGGSPVGLKGYFNRDGRWRGYVTASLGALLFSNEVPIHDSHILNFTIDYGGAMELTTRSGRGLTLGFRFLHFSNAGAGDLNPGLDANVVYVGVARRRERP